MKLRLNVLIGAFVLAATVSAVERTWSLFNRSDSAPTSRPSISVEATGPQYVPQFSLLDLDGRRLPGEQILSGDINVLCFGSFT